MTEGSNTVEPLTTLEQARVITLDPIEVTATPEAENSAAATESRGDAKWQTCWRHACYLSKYVYKQPPPPDGFKTRFPEKMAEVEKHWEKWDEKVEQRGSGLVARLFKVKGYDPSSKADVCPPTLAFRGTDFEDMRGLAIIATIRLSKGALFWTWEFPFVLDKTLKKDSTRKQLVNYGFVPIPIYHEKGSVRGQTLVDGTWLTLGVELKLDILAKENGDWANNIQQGLGMGSVQYKKAIEYGGKVAEEKIVQAADKRLELTGHSLGGGLASAVCTVLDRLYPDVSFHAIVFNPSGVHPNTLGAAGKSDGLIHTFTVDDEILTTLQSFRGKLPVVGAFFDLARKTINLDGMPEALGTLRVENGFSPGETDEKWNVPAKGTELPKLFPINQQTLIPPPRQSGFPAVTNLDTLLRGANSASIFGTRFLQYLNTRYRESARAAFGWRPYTIIGFYEKMIEQYWENLKPEIEALEKLIEASVSYHGMDYVIATYEKHLNSSEK